MQNKPNSLNAQMKVSSVLTKDYENDNTFRLPENKANTNPIQSQNKPNPRNVQNERNFYFNKGLQKKRRFRSPKKQNQNKPNQTQPVVSLSNLFQRQKMLRIAQDKCARNDDFYTPHSHLRLCNPRNKLRG